MDKTNFAVHDNFLFKFMHSHCQSSISNFKFYYLRAFINQHRPLTVAVVIMLSKYLPLIIVNNYCEISVVYWYKSILEHC